MACNSENVPNGGAPRKAVINAVPGINSCFCTLIFPTPDIVWNSIDDRPTPKYKLKIDPAEPLDQKERPKPATILLSDLRAGINPEY